MSALYPVNRSKAYRAIASVLRGEAAPAPDPSGTRAAAVARLASVLAETGGSAQNASGVPVYANQLPETLPSRAVLIQRATAPGGARPRVPSPGNMVPLDIHVLMLADASEGDPAVVLERIYGEVYLALHGSEPGYTSGTDARSEHAMHLYLSDRTEGMQRYDDRFAFDAAFGRAALYSTHAAA